jgi:hypothetical protein
MRWTSTRYVYVFCVCIFAVHNVLHHTINTLFLTHIQAIKDVTKAEIANVFSGIYLEQVCVCACMYVCVCVCIMFIYIYMYKHILINIHVTGQHC